MKLQPHFILSGIIGFALANSSPAEPTSSEWEGVIQSFEAVDQASPVPDGAILFIGSSSIRGWRSLETDFPGFTIINRGFGGSEIQDSIHFADRIVLPYRPSLIVFYAGENDINAGRSPHGVAADFKAFVDIVRDSLPGTKIAFIAMKPSPSRWHLANVKREGNALIREFISGAPGVDYIDVWEVMLNEDGEPRAELFVEDRLHLNAEGYALWKSLVAPHLHHHAAAQKQHSPKN